MPITTVGIGAAVTPTVIKTYLSHYTDRKPRRQKPTAHISYDEGLSVIRSFLEYASHHTVEDLQAFTSQWVPNPSWVRTENVTIPNEYISKAAETINIQLGEAGVQQIGGKTWWQWRRPNSELKAEWIEMRADYNARKQLQQSCKRIMLYVHGGAYFFGSVDEHRYQLQRHARKLKAKVFAPRYRLAPQFPFPCGLHDCLASYLYLLSLHDKTEIILAGDSAGGGMVVSILCMLRDQGLPLPAGAILISPWVDLTHSFPSVADDNVFDYIPAHGFMQKPSVSWPPPNDDDMAAITKGAGGQLVKGHNKLEKPAVQKERAAGVVVTEPTTANEKLEPTGIETPTGGQEKAAQTDTRIPAPNKHLTIEIEGKIVELRDQIQMYTTNQLISHPLVSPVLQPSLGGLPPLLILTGGGEMLRDEQIYLAHKAANPLKYPLGEEYTRRYDPGKEILNKYKPTQVYLQVWEDLCHVAPTLSFTRPAKYMYRSVAQFGAWALSRAQDANIEIVDDDNISIISASESDSEESERSAEKRKAALEKRNVQLGAIGKAGDPLPAFKQSMIRQRIDRHGNIYPLDGPSELAALRLNPDEIGVIKVGPVKKWMDAKQIWDSKYARSKRRVQDQRIKDLVQQQKKAAEDDETPPPSALAGRKHEAKQMTTEKHKKSFYMAMWSGWGSKHDEDTIKREQDAAKVEESSTTDAANGDPVEGVKNKKSRSLSRSRKVSDSKKAGTKSPSRTRKDGPTKIDGPPVAGNSSPQQEVPPEVPAITTTAVASGAAAGAVAASQQDGPRDEQSPVHRNSSLDANAHNLFLAKFKAQQHLRADSGNISDAASVRTGVSTATISDNASTMAVFAAPGVSKQKSAVPDDDGTSPLGKSHITSDDASDKASTIRDHDSKRPASALGGYDTPSSRRSVERLMSHQIDVTGPEGETQSIVSANDLYTAGLVANPADGTGKENTNLTRLQMTRSPSSMAVVQAEGVVGVVDGGNADVTPRVSPERGAIPVTDEKLERPTMYDRSDTDFQTAMEKL